MLANRARLRTTCARTRGCGAGGRGARSRRVDEPLACLSLLLPLVEERLVPCLGRGAGRLEVGVDLVRERLERVAHAVDGLFQLLSCVLPRVTRGLGRLVELGPRLRLPLPERVDRLLEPITGLGTGEVRLDLQLVDLLLELLERLAGLGAVLVLVGHGCSSPVPASGLTRYAVHASSGTVQPPSTQEVSWPSRMRASISSS